MLIDKFYDLKVKKYNPDIANIRDLYRYFMDSGLRDDDLKMSLNDFELLSGNIYFAHTNDFICGVIILQNENYPIKYNTDKPVLYMHYTIPYMCREHTIVEFLKTVKEYYPDGICICSIAQSKIWNYEFLGFKLFHTTLNLVSQKSVNYYSIEL